VRVKRTTALALAASAALVIGSGVVASSAILGLPLFGFGGHEATGSAATAASTPSPSVVDQTVYDDHYVTSPAQSGSPGAVHTPSEPTAAFASLGVRSAAPSAATTPAPAAPPTTASPTTASPTTLATTTTTVAAAGPPPPPPGCREPEWDPEHHVWQCSRGD
jgi:hypothetical protein